MRKNHFVDCVSHPVNKYFLSVYCGQTLFLGLGIQHRANMWQPDSWSLYLRRNCKRQYPQCEHFVICPEKISGTVALCQRRKADGWAVDILEGCILDFLDTPEEQGSPCGLNRVNGTRGIKHEVRQNKAYPGDLTFLFYSWLHVWVFACSTHM